MFYLTYSENMYLSPGWAASIQPMLVGKQLVLVLGLRLEIGKVIKANSVIAKKNQVFLLCFYSRCNMKIHFSNRTLLFNKVFFDICFGTLFDQPMR